eukprot:2405845-Ditylum_brightwellii.AAC.1
MTTSARTFANYTAKTEQQNQTSYPFNTPLSNNYNKVKPTSLLTVTRTSDQRSLKQTATPRWHFKTIFTTKKTTG